MITNILNQSFSDFAQKAKTVEEKAVVSPQRQRLDLLADYYTNRVSNNETELVTKYAETLVSGGQPRLPDPRLFMRRDLLGLVQDSYALGIADGITDLEDVQFASKKTDADFAVSPDDKLQKDIARLQRDIQASQQIVRQTKTLNQYTNTLQTLQQQAQALNNTEATQILNQLSEQLQTLKTNNTVRSVGKLVNQQLQKGQAQQSQAQSVVQEQIAAQGQPNTQDYLVKRAIEEKLKYLENRRDSLAATPPVILDEDKDFFRWYADKRLVPIANRYQQGLVDKNNEAKEIVTKYTEEIGGATTAQTAKGAITDKVVRKMLNIENTSTGSKGRPIKRVQRVVATELAIAYNIGRLKAYMKAGIQYVTISTSMYSPEVCEYCLDTEKKTQQEPISIASLLKRAYKNEGFNKDLNRPVESRYCPAHPYCYCFYKPHPKQDPEEKQDSEGIYGDPNSWKFILGAGLGVSLAFLAFALTTGRKIQVPSTIPLEVPKINLPVSSRQRIPDTIPIDVEPLRTPQVTAIAPDLRDPLSMRIQYQTLLEKVDALEIPPIQKNALKLDLLNVARNPELPQVEQLLESELLVAKASNPETAKDIVDTIAKTSGLTKELYFTRFDKIASVFNKTVSAQPTIDRLAARVDSYVDSVDGKAIIRAANNIEKTKLDKQLQPISLLRYDLAQSLQRVSNKVNKKQADLTYINDLQARITDLDNFADILNKQKTELANIRASVRIVNKAVVNQQIAIVKSVVDRLQTDSDLLQEAVGAYENLLEMLVVLPQKEATKYRKVQSDLNRRIKKAQGIELKRFVGFTIGFSSMAQQKYSY